MSGRRAGSRPSTCSSSATAGSASSPATSSRSRRGRRRAGGRTPSRAAGLDAHATSRTATSRSTAAGERSARSLHATNGDRPTAVICSNDLMAIGALQEAVALGPARPDELSIVGFDGIEAASWTQPALTTVEQPIDEIAETAIEALQALVDDPGQTLPSYVFRPTLRVGGTTSPGHPVALTAPRARDARRGGRRTARSATPTLVEPDGEARRAKRRSAASDTQRSETPSPTYANRAEPVNRRRACSARRRRSRSARRGTSARQPAGSASTWFATTRAAIPSRSRIGVDQLVEAGRHDQRVVLLDQLAEPGAHAHVLEEPRDDLLERRGIVAISAAITSSSVSVRPSSSSSPWKTSSRRTARSPCAACRARSPSRPSRGRAGAARCLIRHSVVRPRAATSRRRSRASARGSSRRPASRGTRRRRRRPPA